MNRINAAFKQALAERRPAFMPYFTMGYPDLATTEKMISAAISSGADIIECGIPFSDPMADGPVIQRSSQAALAAGVTVDGIFTTAAALRKKHPATPLLLMSYYNVVFHAGIDNFAGRMQAAGIDGLILPDLPPENAGEVSPALHERHMKLVQFLAPTSSDERILDVAEIAEGFVYFFALAGVTGERDRTRDGLAELVGKFRQASRVPCAVGFGVSRREHVVEYGKIFDGVIVGSAIVSVVTAALEAGQDPVAAVAAAVKALARG